MGNPVNSVAWLARKLDQTSELGRLLDPIADRLYILAVVIGLASGHLSTHLITPRPRWSMSTGMKGSNRHIPAFCSATLREDGGD